MFDWLFENRVKGTLYFKETCGKHFDGLYTDAYNKLDEVRRITLHAENVKVYLHYLATGMFPDEYFDDCVVSPDENRLFGEGAYDFYENGGEITFRIEVDCWEGAWKELEKLPWVTRAVKGE